MQVGNIITEDLDVIHRLHAESAFDYKLPIFAMNPRFPIQRSLRHKGKFLAAVLGKLELEIYLFVDHMIGTPQERYEALQLLHRDLVARVQELGLDAMFCVLPPPVEKSFGPRLEEHGWQRDRGWSKYTREL